MIVLSVGEIVVLGLDLFYLGKRWHSFGGAREMGLVEGHGDSWSEGDRC